jgi:hypothetical protein
MIGPDAVTMGQRTRVQRATIAGLLAAIAMVAVALGLSVAFGDDDGPDPIESAPPTPPPTTARASSTITTAPTTGPPTTTPPTSARPAPTTAPPTSAPATTVPPTTGAPDRPRLASDVDGDGTADAVFLATDEGTGTLQLRVELSSVGARQVAVETPTVDLATVMGAVDVDGDGRAEVFVRTTAGASTALGSVFRLDGDSLVRVAFEGVGAEFAVHGAVRHLDGLRCSDGGIELSSAVSEDGRTYDVTVLRYEPSDDAAVFALVDQRSVTAEPDEVLSEVDCGSLPRDWYP